MELDARLKLNDPLFVKDEQNNYVKITRHDDPKKLNLTINLTIDFMDAAPETGNASLDSLIENNFRDIEFDSNLIGNKGHDNGLLELRKKDPSKNEGSSELLLKLLLDPKIPYSGG
ncbi:MAG: hypothetical protein ABJO02_16060 [Reichenbachiella sp.]|uniref:hypothetical protein n=1 Tax=Reichenbachiella sp. TaxID=2184521 RepID=UPI0029666110|nr:hypothetical protein [Reichenbachiella sp.]MDW3210642.1 hypothetical protein [Reichenbachiella sp.]